MKIDSFENCVNFYKSFDQWDEKFNLYHEKLLTELPFSLVIEGDFSELRQAINWCLNNIGKRSNKNIDSENIDFRKLDQNSSSGIWSELWYEKSDYDYGSSEFFFKNKEDLEKFKLEIPNFYLEYGKKKWRSNGYNNNEEIV